ncbi:MAG TPA: tetratricopeptide repeat protein [Terricaulis sp.]|nr:tetratricopeptide repeat protein [Terricaulis sp.]HRP09875.1 tetratricopeptide repeat protein [Terricaulis sp.]
MSGRFALGAMALIQRRDFEAALREGEAALKADPRHPGALQLAGALHCQLGRPDKGAPLLERSLALAENQTTRLNLAKALLDAGRAADARAVLRKSAPSPDAARLLGDVLKSSGDLSGAIAAFRDAVRQRPDYADAWNNLGNALRETGDLDAALEALMRAVQLNPRAATIQLNLARALSAADQPEAAFQAAQAALNLAPHDPHAKLESAKLHIVAERFDEALTLLEAVAPAAGQRRRFLGGQGIG